MQRKFSGVAVLVIPAAACSADPAYSVTFERSEGGAGVRVTAQFKGDGDGSTRVATKGDWGGVKSDPREFTALAASAGNEPVEVVQGEGCEWTILHDPGAALTLVYELREPADRQALGVGRNDYRTRVRPGLFQMIGNHGLLYPAHLEDGTPHEHRVEWIGFEGEGVHTVSSFGPGRVETVTAGGSEFRHALFFAGRLALVEETINGGRVAVAISGDDWGFTPRQFADLAFKIIRTEREFFDDHSDPWYLVSVTPEARTSDRVFSLGGTALTNCFALYCIAGLSLDEQAGHVEQIRHVLAHEYFHTWNGVKFHIEGPEGSNDWFSEGFTEYFTRRMLRLAGLWDDAALLANLNESIAGYDSNAKKNAPNDQVRAGFWSDPDLSQLPYRRGDLVALCVDEEIRRVSNGNRTLDDVFRQIVRRSRDSGVMPDRAALLATIEEETSAAFVGRILACVEEGADPPLPERISELGATLAWGSMQSFDPGFDTKASGEQKRIVAVREGSGAAKAGLKDGMPLRHASIRGGNSGDPPRGAVEVEVDGQWRTVEYEAVGPVHQVRAYRR